MDLFRLPVRLLLSTVALGCATSSCSSSDSGIVPSSMSGSAGASVISGSSAGTSAQGGSSGLSGGGGSSVSGTGGSAFSAGGTPPLLVWPNATSSVNSDPWLSQHHTEIQEMHPRFLVINFANNRKLTDVEARFQTQKDWMMEGSRH
ncbi:MAG TPA: hypothetical protein VNW92_00685, partial [Polyangiaceae bacterium]|nr:hypothetical protein [Polyangiaceae bacterium]